MKKIVIFLYLVLTTSFAFSQEALSKKQMTQDFDQLVKLIEKGNPQCYVRKHVTGFDNVKAIKSLKKNIDTLSENESFFNLLKQALAYLMDPHTRETYAFNLDIDDLEGIDTAFMKIREAYYSSNEYIQKYKNVSYFAMYPQYYNFDYYLIGNNYLVNKNDTLHIYFMKLLSYNGLDYPAYVLENCRKQDYRYDYTHKMFYYADWGFRPPRKGKIIGMQHDSLIEFNIEDYPGAILGDKINIHLEGVPEGENFIKKDQVNYFEEDSILYIYIDIMNKDNSFYERIKEVGRNKSINKVVIDVRGNPGGSDYVWLNTLSAITKDTLPYNIQLAFKDNKMMRRKFKKYLNEFQNQKLVWLDNQNYWIIPGNQMKIIPDSNSLQYDKNIYVLSDRNTYSAGHSLVNYANLSDKLISIGNPTGRMVGFGIAPLLFQLKHSKFTFRMPVAIDITNAHKLLDLYQDMIEVEVYPSIEEELIHPRSKYDIKSKEYLYNYDSMFRKILETKKENFHTKAAD